MNISEFIREQVHPVVAEWVEFARAQQPSAHRLSVEELADHARLLLLAIAADLKHGQGAQARHDKSQGSLPSNAPDITRIAQDHAAQRFTQGFDLDNLVSEFRALRASVIRRWRLQVESVTHESLDELTRFGEAMDQALMASASLYSRKVEESRNLLLAVLGHDLRTPLGVVYATAQYLLHTDTLNGAQSKAVARMLTSAERMKSMVNDILDFTQTSLGTRLPLSPVAADIGEVTANIVGEVKALHGDASIDFASESDLAGCWDVARIGQLLSNLIANAVQHGDREKPVSVRVTGQDDQVSVRIHNDGPPISAEALKNLFTPLRQSSAAGMDRDRGSSGLGLGLYIAREIATAHGGSVEVASSLEQGTTVCVRLPRKPGIRL